MPTPAAEHNQNQPGRAPARPSGYGPPGAGTAIRVPGS